MTTASSQLSTKLMPTEASISTAENAKAAGTGTMPAAIGRLRLVGCARSASTSLASLTR